MDEDRSEKNVKGMKRKESLMEWPYVSLRLYCKSFCGINKSSRCQYVFKTYMQHEYSVNACESDGPTDMAIDRRTDGEIYR